MSDLIIRGWSDLVDAELHPALSVEKVDGRVIYEALLARGLTVQRDKWRKLTTTRTFLEQDGEPPHSYFAAWIAADQRRRWLDIEWRQYMRREQFQDYISWGVPSHRHIRIDALHGLPISKIEQWWDVLTLRELGFDVDVREEASA